MNGEDQSQSTANTRQVVLKPFNPAKPEIWFGGAECLMALAGVTCPRLKAECVVRALDTEAMEELTDILTELPTFQGDTYQHVKQTMLTRFGNSKAKKTRLLLEDQAIGDRTPSQFLRHLKTLAGSSVTDDVLRAIWMKGLPHDMQNAVITKTDASLTHLADMADLIHENHQLRSGRNICATVSAAQQEPAEPPEGQLRLILAQMQAQLDELRMSQARSRSRSRSSRSHSRSRSRSRPEGWKCWYHYKFGPAAAKCVQPCAYKSPAAGNASGSH